MPQNQQKGFLNIEFRDKNDQINVNLSKCPAGLQDVQGALCFLTPGCSLLIDIQEQPIDYLGEDSHE